MSFTALFYGGAGQGTVITAPTPLIAQTGQYATLDAAASVTVTGATGKKVIVRQVVWSYSSAPTGGSLTITDGTDTFFSIDITAAGPGQVTFDPPMALTVSTNGIITLADPQGSVVSKLWVNAYVEK